MPALDPKHGLTVLTRLAGRCPEQAWMLEKALRSRLHALAEIALEVGAETGDPIGRITASLLSNEPDTALAERLFRLLPLETVALREVAVEVTRQCLEQWRKRGDDVLVAKYTTDLANRLSELGRREEALAAAQEAVTHFRALAKDKPDVVHDLASSLHTLAIMLGELGPRRHEEALAAAQEAVEIYRLLAKDKPDALRPYLGRSLNSLAKWLRERDRREEALAAIEEAVTHYRALGPADRHGLAISLTTLAIMLGARGRYEEALAAAQETIALRRLLAEDKPDAFRPYLAGSLITLANRLRELDRPEEALAAIEEAVTHYRALAEARPEVFRHDLARSLHTLANRLTELNRREEAFAAFVESATLLSRR